MAFNSDKNGHNENNSNNTRKRYVPPHKRGNVSHDSLDSNHHSNDYQSHKNNYHTSSPHASYNPHQPHRQYQPYPRHQPYHHHQQQPQHHKPRHYPNDRRRPYRGRGNSHRGRKRYFNHEDRNSHQYNTRNQHHQHAQYYASDAAHDQRAYHHSSPPAQTLSPHSASYYGHKSPTFSQSPPSKEQSPFLQEDLMNLNLSHSQQHKQDESSLHTQSQSQSQDIRFVSEDNEDYGALDDFGDHADDAEVQAEQPVDDESKPDTEETPKEPETATVDEAKDNEEDQEVAESPQQEEAKEERKSAKQIAFEEHLQEYEQQHEKKYIAPFVIRRLRKEFDHEWKEQRRRERAERRQAREAQKNAEKEAHDEDDNDNDNDNGNDDDAQTASPGTDDGTETKTINEDENNTEQQPEHKEKENENKQEEAKEKSKEEDTYPVEYLFFREWYIKHSKYYNQWQDTRHDGWNSKHLEKFFDLKHKNQDNKSRSSDKNIVALFRRFYRYAIDIDNVCGYREHLISLLANNQNHTRNVYFLDIGFAPGGMSRLLLDAHENIYGVGITLPPYESGNVYVSELLNDRRFLCREHDIVELGKKVKNRLNFMVECIENDYSTHVHLDLDEDKKHHHHHERHHHDENTSLSPVWRTEFAGFDLVIVGITCHQDFNSNERLDHQILLSELYIAFLTLSNGGSVLIRHKIALDCIHQHILYIFLKCFDCYTVGKPLTEFAIRKTFWILWKGFNKKVCKELKLIQKLRKLIHEYDGHAPPYGKNPKTHQYFNPSMIDKTPQQIVDELEDSILNVMDPVFQVQMKSLRSFCSGKKDRLCNRKEQCRRTDCNRAHSKDECLEGFFDAMVNVDQVVQHEIYYHKHQSRILAALEANMRHKNNSHRHPQRRSRQSQQRQRKKYDDFYHHHNDSNLENNWRRNDD